jgi:hypothetical protein
MMFLLRDDRTRKGTLNMMASCTRERLDLKARPSLEGTLGRSTSCARWRREIIRLTTLTHAEVTGPKLRSCPYPVMNSVRMQPSVDPHTDFARGASHQTNEVV